MAQSLFSPSWYRVADFRPRLRSHAQLHRQKFRGQTWYILQDHQNGRFHRCSPAARHMILLMDGRRTVREIWELTGERMGNDQPTQDETIRLLAQLHSSDLLLGDMPPDMAELAERSERQGRRELLARVKNPMALRFSLVDPDRFLEASVELVRPVFSVTGFLLWLALVVSGAVVTILNLPELMSGVADRVLTVENALLMLLVYPFIKALHELGHAYATKVWGGEVHEFGIMFLVLILVGSVVAAISILVDKNF